MPRILVAEPIAQAGIDLLTAAHETSVRLRPPRAELLAALPGAGRGGKPLGVIGRGKMGKAVARRAASFEMQVIAYDPFLTAEQAADHGVQLVGLPELLAQSDVVTRHAPVAAG